MQTSGSPLATRSFTGIKVNSLKLILPRSSTVKSRSLLALSYCPVHCFRSHLRPKLSSASTKIEFIVVVFFNLRFTALPVCLWIPSGPSPSLCLQRNQRRMRKLRTSQSGRNARSESFRLHFVLYRIVNRVSLWFGLLHHSHKVSGSIL